MEREVLACQESKQSRSFWGNAVAHSVSQSTQLPMMAVVIPSSQYSQLAKVRSSVTTYCRMPTMALWHSPSMRHHKLVNMRSSVRQHRNVSTARRLRIELVQHQRGKMCTVVIAVPMLAMNNQLPSSGPGEQRPSRK